MAAQESGPARLTLELRNLARVPPAVLRETRTEVDRTFLASGVSIAWAEAESSPEDPRVLKVFVTGGPATGARSHDERGAVAGWAPRSGNCVQVYYRRVTAAVADRQVPISVILAHVISHELGHLLLPPDSHAPFGIMRRDIDLEHPAFRRFTAEHSRLIRAAVASGRRHRSRCE